MLIYLKGKCISSLKEFNLTSGEEVGRLDKQIMKKRRERELIAVYKVMKMKIIDIPTLFAWD